MKRFYNKSLKTLERSHKELTDDINSYVCYLEHIQAVLISELAKNETWSSAMLSKRLGYPINNTKGKEV